MIIPFFPLWSKPGSCVSIVVLGASLLLSGCSQLGYYAQAARGQLELLSKRQPVTALLENEQTDPSLRQQLLLAQRLRQFGAERLGLQDNRTFTRYADLGRPFVVWNLVAAPRYSIAPRTWCFPIAGCVAYKGFFRERAAREAAMVSKQQGDDVFVYGVSAYSTLGWFEDPLLNTFIHFPESGLAAMIFHELTHQAVYVRDDSAFNEAFATAVEYALVAEWFTLEENTAALEQFGARRQLHNAITETVLGYRDRLDDMYRETMSGAEKARKKDALFAALKDEYVAIQQSGRGTRFYDWWFRQPLNNAHLLTVATYFRQVPAISALIDRYDGDLQSLFEDVRRLGPGIVKDTAE